MATKDAKCSICRRAGEKLFLKGEKCFSPSCVFNKKPYAPGKTDAERKRRTTMTEYGRQLREKQKVRNVYGMRERQFSNYVKSAISRAGSNPTAALYELLELRLDNAVFRFGLASSRALARQMVSHGHITVNGRKVTIPSYRLRVGDKIAVREGSRGSSLFTNAEEKMKKGQTSNWLKADMKSLSAEVVAPPKAEKSELPFDLASVIEYYSR